MAHDTSYADAQLALHTIDERRREVADEVGVPRWYWWGVALGWVAVGAVADTGNPWATGASTLVFGAAHAAAASHALSGQQASSQLRVRRDLVGGHLRSAVLAVIVALGALTVALGFLADADGARHPATMASVVPAVIVLCGGPGLVRRLVRR